MAALAGRKALVTGGSRGIGRAIALAFATEGADVAICYASRIDRERPDPDAFADVARQIEQMGRRAVVVDADVSVADEVEALVGRVLGEFGRIDILVNNAGGGVGGRLEELDVATWDAVIANNLRSTFLVTRSVLPGMLERGDGRIINMASQLGQIGRDGLTAYAAAKAGIIGFTKSLAREVATRGVLVNCLAPGPIDTRMMLAPSDQGAFDIVEELPIRRLGQPQEVASTAVFLASDAATFFVGQTLGPNGGHVML